MTTLSFDEDGVDVVYEGTEFHLEKEMVENATQQSYMSVTDHQVLKMIEPDPALSGEPREIRDILR